MSNLEASVSLALVLLLATVIAGWESATRVVAVPFLALLLVFTIRAIYRKLQGGSWDEAWGRQPPNPG